MGFEINLSQLINIAKLGGNNKQIDGDNEIRQAKLLFASNPTDEIGDTVKFSNKPKAAFTTSDMLAELSKDPNIDMAKMNKYMQKPVATLPSSFEVNIPAETQTMAKMAQDVDIDKLNAYLDAAFASGAADRADKFAEEFEALNGDDKNAQTAYTIGVLHDIGALKED